MVDLRDTIELDLDDLTTSIVDVRANDEALNAALQSMADGDDVTSLRKTLQRPSAQHERGIRTVMYSMSDIMCVGWGWWGCRFGGGGSLERKEGGKNVSEEFGWEWEAVQRSGYHASLIDRLAIVLDRASLSSSSTPPPTTTKTTTSTPTTPTTTQSRQHPTQPPIQRRKEATLTFKNSPKASARCLGRCGRVVGRK